MYAFLLLTLDIMYAFLLLTLDIMYAFSTRFSHALCQMHTHLISCMPYATCTRFSYVI